MELFHRGHRKNTTPVERPAVSEDDLDPLAVGAGLNIMDVVDGYVDPQDIWKDFDPAILKLGVEAGKHRGSEACDESNLTV